MYLNCTLPVEQLQCEEKYGGLFRGVGPAGSYFPAWGSSISSFVMIWCGCHMIMFWVHDSALMKVVGAMFFVNGWSAFGAHTFNNALCGAVDKLSMLFTVWLVAGFCFEELIEASSAYDSSTKYFASCSFMKWYDGLLMPLAGVREVSGKESSKAAVKATAERSFNRSFFTGGLWCGCCSLLWWAVGKEIDAPDQGFFIMM